MRSGVILSSVLAFVIMFSCGEDSTGPSSANLTPSALSLAFTGDSSKIGTDNALSYSRLQNPSVASSRGNIDYSKGNCEVTASWTICPESSFNSYVLYRSESSGIPSDPSSANVLGVFSDPNTTEYTDTDIDWATEYHYALRTTDSDDNGVWSNEDSLVTPGAVTPSVLLATSITYSLVELLWTQCPDGDFDSYSLYRSFTPNIQSDTNSAEQISISSLSTDTTFTDNEVTSNTTYYYALMIVNTKDISGWSNEIEVITPSEPNIPDSVVATVNVDERPYGICILPSGEYVYVANIYDEKVTVIRTSDNSVIDHITVGNMAYDICSLPSGEYVYVSMYGENNVKVIRTSDNTIVATISVGDVPSGICTLPSGEYVYVTNMSDGSVSVIRTSDNTVNATVDVGTSPYGICSLPSGEYVYVSNSQDDNVNVIRTSDNSVVATINVGYWPFRVCSLPTGDYVYVVNNHDDNVSVIRTADNSVIKTINVGDTPQSICALPSGEYVYVTNYNSNTITIISTSMNEVVNTIEEVVNPFAICAHPSGEHIYASGLYFDNVYVIE